MSIKERRSYPRILMGGNVKFGMDNPIHDGTSYVYSPNGMSVITDEVLPAKSNIIIEIDAEIGVVTVKGEVIRESSIPDLPSVMGIKFSMGIKFNKSNERLVRIYKGKNQVWDDGNNLCNGNRQ